MKDLIKPKTNNYNPIISSDSVLLQGKNINFEEKYLLIEKYLSEFETEEQKKLARDNIGVYSSEQIDQELEEIRELIQQEVDNLRGDLGTREDGPVEDGTAFERISYLSQRIDNLIDNASEDYNTLRKIEQIIKAEIERSTQKDNYFQEELDKFPDTVMSRLLDNTLNPDSVQLNYGVNKRSTSQVYTESREIASATQENAGVMSAQDKVNLDVTLPNKITEESNRAQQKEQELDEKIDTTKSDIIGSATSDNDTLGKLESNLNAEIERATNKENSIEQNLNSHISNQQNPHNVTKAQVGLGNADNTSDMDKPISTATQSALDELDNRLSESITTHIANTSNPHNVTVQQIGAIPTGGLKTINGNTLEGEGNIDLIYNADDILFTSDLTITANVGVHTVGSSGSKTLPTTGKSVKQVMDLLFSEEKNPTITQPYVNLSSSTMGAKEVGTNIIPVYTASLNPGTYQFGPATGVTATSWVITDTNGGNKTEASGSFEEFQVIDNTSYKITAVAQHTEGTIPLTNLGNEYAVGKIQAGSKTKQVGTITGYRNSFYGTLEDKGELTSTVIRTLGKSNKALSNGSTFNITIPVGALRVVIAYPATLRNLTSVSDVNGLGAEIVTSFTEIRVNVEGVNRYQAIEYKVYYLDYANPNNTNNTYKVTI